MTATQSLSERLREDVERQLRFHMTNLCLAVLSKEEGRLRECKDMLVDKVCELIAEGAPMIDAQSLSERLPRFVLRNGKYGPYFHDKNRGGKDGFDMPLEHVLEKLNRLEEYTQRLAAINDEEPSE